MNRATLTVTEAAARLGMSTKGVARLCQTGQMAGAVLRHRRLWLIPAESVEGWQVRGRGRPRKGTSEE